MSTEFSCVSCGTMKEQQHLSLDVMTKLRVCNECFCLSVLGFRSMREFRQSFAPITVTLSHESSYGFSVPLDEDEWDSAVELN